jgi:hypothetical protein
VAIVQGLPVGLEILEAGEVVVGRDRLEVSRDTLSYYTAYALISALLLYCQCSDFRRMRKTGNDFNGAAPSHLRP